MLLLYAASLSVFIQLAFAATRTSPPSGSYVVRSGTSTSGEYKTVASAVAALPNDGAEKVIFIYPGTYKEQVYITRDSVTIYGYTSDTTSYSANQVTLTQSVTAGDAGSNDASGTLRIHGDNVSIYNINIANSYGKGTQAIALSEYGSKVGVYASKITGYQDTLLVNDGTSVFLDSYIEGATDFIFGRRGKAYFQGNTIAVSGKGYITASGRESDDDTSYVFESNTVVLASGAASDTSGGQYLGRPWGEYAKVIFKNTNVTAKLNPAIWSVWNSGDTRTGHVLFGEYNTVGSGVSGASRPSFATVLSSSQASAYSISSAVGSDYASWVDADYL
ncbi:carbohydrate esterase family 8 protein [Cylindrobasidium torrendii FP15055 ss-10]|uniref:Pectinesterase n=1 Tax=Cylindrobasidium torrendii FP15055 ss-10 TaxID=1314674 RepID=A0A0D7BFA7_9AGAR|nr:carbohydrate esterase family 8 protein [Cylindrobasidium torrendii FP15055 ss-10]